MEEQSAGLLLARLGTALEALVARRAGLAVHLGHPKLLAILQYA